MRQLAITLAAAALTALGAALTSPASAGPLACGATGNDPNGYAYAGQEAKLVAHGIRATITPLVPAPVETGHVAAWVGVGGLQDGQQGVDEWLQVGVASLPDEELLLYAEVMRPGGGPTFIELKASVEVGESHRLAVLEVSRRPNWWRIWVDGRAATKPMHLPGSNRSWQPIATAESLTTGPRVCPKFAFRFAEVQVATGLGGSWQVFASGRRILDSGFRVRVLSPGRQGSGRAPFSFEALSP